jgi:hypothetical protein
MDSIKVNTLIKSLIIAIVYVGLGTISVLSMYPSSPTYGAWSIYTLILTLPVSLISFGIEFTEQNALIPVIITQTIIFFLFWYIVYTKIRKRKTNHN